MFTSMSGCCYAMYGFSGCANKSIDLVCQSRLVSSILTLLHAFSEKIGNEAMREIVVRIILVHISTCLVYLYFLDYLDHVPFYGYWN